MSGLRLRMRKIGDGVALINTAGYLDAHTFVEMDEAIERLFQANIYRIVVEMSMLDYISSAGAGVFISKIGEATANGGNIVFLSPSEPVREVFDLLGLTQIFPIADDEREAMKHLGGDG